MGWIKPRLVPHSDGIIVIIRKNQQKLIVKLIVLAEEIRLNKIQIMLNKILFEIRVT